VTRSGLRYRLGSPRERHTGRQQSQSGARRSRFSACLRRRADCDRELRRARRFVCRCVSVRRSLEGCEPGSHIELLPNALVGHRRLYLARLRRTDPEAGIGPGEPSGGPSRRHVDRKYRSLPEVFGCAWKLNGGSHSIGLRSRLLVVLRWITPSTRRCVCPTRRSTDRCSSRLVAPFARS